MKVQAWQAYAFAIPLLALALSGCHNRAYNELYIEGMAAEIRDLEDQLYEYDDHTRQLEQELASLRAENARLIKDPQLQPRSKPGVGLELLPRPTPAPLETLPPGSADRNPAPLPGLPDEPSAGSEPRSILDAPASRPSSSPPSDSGPPPTEETLPTPLRNWRDAQPLLPENSPSVEELPSLDFDPSGLDLPAIEPGEPMPPPEAGNGFTSLESSSPQLDDSRIELPAQLVGHRAEQPTLDRSAELTITDRRVVELAFSSLHCRSVNMDEDAADDGVVLVLQPKNAAGQVVPVAADLSVVVLDPARDGGQSRIGRWDLSTAAVQRRLQPLGSKQGIELTLPWKGKDPTADRVVVFARYTFENGRQVIGQKEIMVSTAEGLQAIWFPRGGQPMPDGRSEVHAASAVVPAKAK